MQRTDSMKELSFPEPARLPSLAALDEGADAVQGPSGRIFHDRAFCCLRTFDWPRRLAIKCVEHPLFDTLILSTIIVNCITMAWASPMDPPGTAKQELIASLEWVFLAIFTTEMVVKARAARGHRTRAALCHPSRCRSPITPRPSPVVPTSHGPTRTRSHS
jgi:hypothetical protein